MNIGFSAEVVLGMALVMTRISLLFFLTPLDLLGRVPVNVKVLIALSISILYCLTFDAKVPLPPGIITLLLLLCRELMVGLTMAFSIYAVFASFSMAGRLIDFQAGFAAAALFNPSSAEQEGLVSTLYVYIGTALFFSIGAHWVLIKAFIYTLEVLPIGDIALQVTPAQITKIFGLVFSAGVLIASPVITILLMIDAVVGMMSKTMPQMNVYFLFLPLKAVVALVITAMVLPLLQRVFEDLIGQSFLNFAQMIM